MHQSLTHHAGGLLPVMEHFYTIQGEGFHQGKAAYFIRLAGCDVGCIWCDVKESWKVADHPLIHVETIVDAAAMVSSGICVVTGGEPLMHDLEEFTALLHKKSLRTHIETSGVYALTGQWDWICVSPKKFKLPLTELLAVADELKVIIYHKSDLEWAASFADKVRKNCQLFLQPEWSKEAEIIPLIIDYVKQHPHWRISLQVHKYMNIP